MIKKLLKYFALGLCCLLVIGILVINLSPKPIAYLVRKMFDGGIAVAPENFTEIESRVIVEKDKIYPSSARLNTYDLVLPKDTDNTKPTIVWVHGGAFVGGDKQDIYEYAVQIADRGYNVVNMNYELASEATYPTPLRQVNELITYLKNNESDRLNFNNVIIAGDSAGAHIAGQFALVQTQSAYAIKIDIDPVLDEESLKAAVLMCGPYDINALVKRTEESKLLNFFGGKIAWSYLGTRNWKNTNVLADLSITDFVDASFPSSFITDGNSGSFTDHGMALAEKLRSLGVRVSDKFYDESEGKLIHEYQFQMDNPASVETFEALIEFLNQTTKVIEN